MVEIILHEALFSRRDTCLMAEKPVALSRQAQSKVARFRDRGGDSQIPQYDQFMRLQPSWLYAVARSARIGLIPGRAFL
jgi:hypothetical protein